MSVITRSARNINNKTRSVLRLSQPENVIGDGNYKSPGTYIVEVDAALTENIVYSGGSATYIGDDDVQIEIESTYSVSASSAGVDITATTGKNSTPDLDFEMPNTLTSANDVKNLKQTGVHTLSKNDTFDFFIKGSANFTIEKAVWKIRRYDD